MGLRVCRPLPRSSQGNKTEVAAALDALALAPSALLLDALMGYVSTFFHEPRLRREAEAKAASSFSSKNPRYGPASGWLQFSRPGRSLTPAGAVSNHVTKRGFHNYFVTHLPSASLHPDSQPPSGPRGPHHQLPSSASMPHTHRPGSSPAAAPPNLPSRDLTVVRIPLESAKHHFGVHNARGTRRYNEDTYQAGTISIPAFAKRVPVSLVKKQAARPDGEGTSADSAFGDPQVFYFAVFDGHGGSECSEFLRDELHGYIETTAARFGLESSLRRDEQQSSLSGVVPLGSAQAVHSLKRVHMKGAKEVKDEISLPREDRGNVVDKNARMAKLEGSDPVPAEADVAAATKLVKELLGEYRNTVGGYFRRFKPSYLSVEDRTASPAHGASHVEPANGAVSLESVLTYAFLRADLDFISAQARKPGSDDTCASDSPLNRDEVLGRPHLPPSGHGIGGPARFKGGSTASVVLISTPTPAPFWHPAAHSTLAVAHVGDTRVLLCETATGLARPLTSDHHPSSPAESRRLRRFADSLVTDSFGESRISGLANSRAFGDMGSKRIGVSAEPELSRVELRPAEYSFLVLLSDGVSGTLSDQEIVDVVKEARTPEQGSRDVVEYTSEVSVDGDNATCLVVRLGGWERRSEGGLGSLGSKEIRDARRAEALDPRRGRR